MVQKAGGAWLASTHASLPFITNDAANSKIKIRSMSLADEGVYTVKLRAILTDGYNFNNAIGSHGTVNESITF